MAASGQSLAAAAAAAAANAGGVFSMTPTQFSPSLGSSSSNAVTQEQVRNLCKRSSGQQVNAYREMASQFWANMTVEELSVMYNVALTLEHNPMKNLGLLSRNNGQMIDSAKANGYKRTIESSKGFLRSTELTAKWNNILSSRMAKSSLSMETVEKFKWMSVLTSQSVKENMKLMYAEIDSPDTGQHPLKYRKAWFYARPFQDLYVILKDHMNGMWSCVQVIQSSGGMKPFKTEWIYNTGEAASNWLKNAAIPNTKEYHLAHNFFCDPTWGAWAVDWTESPKSYKDFITSFSVTIQQWAFGKFTEIHVFNKDDDGFKLTKRAVSLIRYNIRQRVFSGTGRASGGIARIAGVNQILTFQ